MSDDFTACFRISGPPTEFVRSCFDPTLSRGSVATAYDVPPSAMKSAKVAVTLA